MSPEITVSLLFALGAVPTAETRVVEFVGFSHNEALAAWRIKIVRASADGGCLDELSLVRIVDAQSNETMGEFKDSGPRRRAAPGVTSACPLADFAARNPDWAQASPRQEWQRLRSRAAFFARALALNEDLVHLSRDADAPSDMVGEDKEITVTGRPGRPVGYGPIIRLVNGEDVTLGHARREAVANGAWKVSIKIYHSRTANHVALLHRFAVDGGETIWLGRVFHLADAAATTEVGAIRMMQTEGRLAEKDFKDLHPDLSGEYDEFVGSIPKR
jgi:hypothetical protein